MLIAFFVLTTSRVAMLWPASSEYSRRLGPPFTTFSSATT
jgi:hypothetical protein